MIGSELFQNQFELDDASNRRFLECCHVHAYPNKTAIIRPGDDANTLYYIVSGSVSVTFEDEEGRELILAYLNAGNFIGELGLYVATGQRSVMVRTRTKCELAQISYAKLANLLENDLKDISPKILYAIGKQLSDRLLHTSRKVRRLAFMDVQGRIARTLLDLCQEPDAMTHPEGMQIKVSRQEISRIVGCSREMAGRVIKTLEEEGMITASGKTIVVLGARD